MKNKHTFIYKNKSYDYFSNKKLVSSFYRDESNNILDNIPIKDWSGKLLNSAYDSELVPYVVVALLEFGGFKKELDNLIGSGLPIYQGVNKEIQPFMVSSLKKNALTNFFHGLSKEKVINLYKQTTPEILQFTHGILPYYHQTSAWLDSKFDIYNSPKGMSGHEFNEQVLIKNTIYFNKRPFSIDLIKESWFRKSEDLQKKVSIGKKALEELAEGIKTNSAKLGGRKLKPEECDVLLGF